MLQQNQLEFFAENGYLVVPDVIDQSTIEAVKQEYTDLMDDLYRDWYARDMVALPPEDLSFWDKIGECNLRGIDWFQPLDISLPHNDIAENTQMHFGPAIFDIVTHKRLIDIVEQLIGPEITSNPIQHVRIKPPARTVPKDETRAHITVTDWHQDMGVTLEEADQTKMITVWLAITDATVENGCLQVALGKHNGLLPHCQKTQIGIADSFLPTEQIIPTPVTAGGIVVFHPFTPHSSLPNRSDDFRWSFDLRYNVTGQPTGRSQFPEFIVRSRANPERELKDWKIWRGLWEDTRSHLSTVPHIPQHRWSSDGPYCA